MQNALDVYLETVDALLLDNEVDKAYETLIELDKSMQVGIKNDIILITSNYRNAAKMFNSQQIDFGTYNMQLARAKGGLQDLMKNLPRKIELNAKIKGLSTYQFSVPDEDKLERIVGGASSLLRINWLEKALGASKAVCRVVCTNGEIGTGFLTQDGYVFTNNHVIKTQELAKTARLEFNYEVGSDGKARARTSYEVDGSTYITSTPDKLDFARVKVIDRSDAPLKNWGYVEFDPEAIPTVGEPVTIIQHPKGEDKQIALNANDVRGQYNQYLLYSADTEKGSSGSPVFNKDWKVVAIHHAGGPDMTLNAKGDKGEANRGILFRDIFASIGK